MYNIAICDDEPATCSEIETYIADYCKGNNIVVAMDIFYRGEELKKALEERISYDVLFLDIELPAMKGMELAGEIRNELSNEIMQIIYISSKQQYAMELFKTRPMDFLVKPLDRERVIRDFLQALKIIDKGNHFFVFQTGHVMQKRNYKDILYFQSDNHKVNLVTTDGELNIYGKLDEVISKIEDTGFFRIHKSYFVNSLHVIEYSYEWLKISNGAELPISKKYRAEIRRKIMLQRGI